MLLTSSQSLFPIGDNIVSGLYSRRKHTQIEESLISTQSVYIAVHHVTIELMCKSRSKKWESRQLALFPLLGVYRNLTK